ncbi:MAG: hypothetical protein ABEK59_12185 [Halobacteria archaeon]
MAREYRLTGDFGGGELPAGKVDKIRLAEDGTGNTFKLIAPSASIEVELETDGT